MRLHIFIETGIADAKKMAKQFTNEWYFVYHYVLHLFPSLSDNDFDITDVGGKDKLRLFKNQMRDNAMHGDKNIVIFDCDDVSTGGGMENRRAGFEKMKKELGVEFEYFLFPNNKDEGSFENMLLHIINSEHSGIMDCFSKYEACVGGQNESKGGNVYETPNVKAKIYTYITSFKRSRSASEKIKKGDWDFSNKEYWDLDNEFLSPLKSFLCQHFLGGQ